MLSLSILDLLMKYGYFVILVSLILGVFGLPVPDELLLLFIGYLSSRHLLSLTICLAVSCLGTITGTCLSYFLGRKFGIAPLIKYGKWIRLRPERIHRIENWFVHKGTWAILIGYFIPGIRHVVCYLSGTSAIEPKRYFIYAGIGALLWCVIYILIGYYTGVRFNFSRLMN